MLFGNVGTVSGGLRLFDDARPDDGWLDVGVATADGAVQWARTLDRAAAGNAERTPFVHITRGRSMDVRLGTPIAYELDGGEREPASRLKVRLAPAAVTVCMPPAVP